MYLTEKETFLKEHLDFSDPAITKALSESTDNEDKLIIAITSKLYDKILEKYDKIDFSSVSRSRGDITKIEKYESMRECVDIIRKLVVEYKQDTYPVDVVLSAIENIKSRTTMFKKAFTVNAKLPVVTYNCICMAIVESISFLIGTCIEYIKSPTTESFQMALNTVAYNATRQNLMFESLASFNEACINKEFDESMEICMRKSFKEATEDSIKADKEVKIAVDNPFLDPESIESDDSEVVVHDNDEKVQTEANLGAVIGSIPIVGKAVMFVCKLLIPIIRNITYFFFSTKQKVSDWYTIQADLLQMNAMQLQYDTNIEPSKKKDIYEKQMKIVAKYRDKANKWDIEATKGKKTAEKMAKDDQIKFRSVDFVPDGSDAGVMSRSILF